MPSEGALQKMSADCTGSRRAMRQARFTGCGRRIVYKTMKTLRYVLLLTLWAAVAEAAPAEAPAPATVPETTATVNPAPPSDAEQEVVARLRATLAFLADKNIRNIVLLGHGTGAATALRHAADNQGTVNGLILIAMGKSDDPTLLERAAVPIYDIYGSADGLEVRNAGAQRLTEGRRLVRQEGSGLPRYRQFVVAAADHFFHQHTENRQRRVQGWLRTHAGGMEILLR